MERRFECAARVILDEVNALPSLGFSAPSTRNTFVPASIRSCI